MAATAIEPCRIRGDFVADLSHLMAELIENALVHSAVLLPVEVYGWRDLDEYCSLPPAADDRACGLVRERMRTPLIIGV
ncbi:hypothetical protein ABZY34_21870 [Streptomyces virginiae]|uniref:hypothetical protein n=1 Tax=Streptomyces TaxID=1883 RepID=UPI001064378C|nr:hypothetical protein [Streptomyces sp. KS 21]